MLFRTTQKLSYLLELLQKANGRALTTHAGHGEGAREIGIVLVPGLI
jgi:hypothetical protein